MNKYISIFICFFITTFGFVTTSFADQSLESEISQLRAEMKAMQKQYEARIATLEQKIGTSESKTDSAYDKKGSELELPEISVIVDNVANFTDLETNSTKDKVRVKEAELSFQGYLYPDIRGDFIAALEQEYEDNTVSTEIDIEEAYLSFLNLPFGLQAITGRKLLSFGRLNALHPHHWNFTETPLVMQNLFGHHPWFDDGLELSYLIPNSADLYCKLAFSLYNGKQMGHAHSHSHDADTEAEPEHFGEELIEWDGHVYTGRAVLDIPFSDNFNGSLGYSLALDDNNRNKLHGADFVLRYDIPNSYHKVKWHSEYFYLEENQRNITPYGWFSYLLLGLNKNWETGLKYDWSKFADNDNKHAWAGSAFLTYYFTHSLYLRGEYQYKEHASGRNENQFFIQLVWGIGPHSHRLEE